MKNLIFLFFLLLLITSCEKEAPIILSDQTDIKIETRAPAPKIDICHQTNNGWILINVNENSWPAHAEHGDIRLDDQDGDGYVPNNECGYGEMGDCDDNDNSINPGAEEICADGIDQNCNNEIDENCNCIEGELEVTLPDGSIIYVHPTNSSEWIAWGEYLNDVSDLPNILTLAEAQTDFDGLSNTTAIIAHLNNWNGGNYAAKLCASLSDETGCEWYLPAAGELNAIYQQLGPPPNNNLPSNWYWSSTETRSTDAWAHYFSPSVDIPADQGKLGHFSCRCVRR